MNHTNYNRPIAVAVGSAVAESGISKEDAKKVIESFGKTFYWRARAKDSRDRMTTAMMEVYERGGVDPSDPTEQTPLVKPDPVPVQVVESKPVKTPMSEDDLDIESRITE